MENKKAPNFFLIIIAIILGQALYKQFDFENLTFEKPALAILYIIVFVICIYLLVKKTKTDLKNKRTATTSCIGHSFFSLAKPHTHNNCYANSII